MVCCSLLCSTLLMAATAGAMALMLAAAAAALHRVAASEEKEEEKEATGALAAADREPAHDGRERPTTANEQRIRTRTNQHHGNGSVFNRPSSVHRAPCLLSLHRSDCLWLRAVRPVRTWPVRVTVSATARIAARLVAWSMPPAWARGSTLVEVVRGWC